MFWSVPDPTWANSVHKSAGAIDGIEGAAEVVAEWLGGGDSARASLDLDRGTPAASADEFPYWHDPRRRR
jgi:hypothetical protein